MVVVRVEAAIVFEDGQQKSLTGGPRVPLVGQGRFADVDLDVTVYTKIHPKTRNQPEERRCSKGCSALQCHMVHKYACVYSAALLCVSTTKYTEDRRVSDS